MLVIYIYIQWYDIKSYRILNSYTYFDSVKYSTINLKRITRSLYIKVKIHLLLEKYKILFLYYSIIKYYVECIMSRYLIWLYVQFYNTFWNIIIIIMKFKYFHHIKLWYFCLINFIAHDFARLSNNNITFN